MRLKIGIADKQYEVEVEVAEEDGSSPPPRPSTVPPASGVVASAPGTAPPPRPGGAGAGPKVADESKACRSPIAGIVVRIPAEIGKPVKANEPLVVLEAMKMESSITAPRDCIPARIHVKPGDGVTSGQVLVELE